MAQPDDTFLACVRPKFRTDRLNLDKLLSVPNRYYKARGNYKTYIMANALFRGEFQRNWNNDHTAQILINTGIVTHFIENCGFGGKPKLKKYKKYGSISAGSVCLCMASVVAIAHSPFYTGEYYSKLSPLWQQIAHKVRPTYKVVLRSAVDDLIGPPGILWRPIILPNCFKKLINSETDVFDDISIMPWHSFSNVQIICRPLPITNELPSGGKCFRDVAVQTDEFPAVVATTTKEVQADARPINQTNVNRVKIRKTREWEIRNREVMKAFNEMMARELRRNEMTDENNNEIPKWMSDELMVANQWFPVVSIERSRSIENLVANAHSDEPPVKRIMRDATI